MRHGRAWHRGVVALVVVALAALICVQGVTAYGTECHQYTVEEGLKVYTDAELPTYDPEIAIYASYIVQGARSPDYNDYVYGYGGFYTTLTHFWNADLGPGEYQTITGDSTNYENAYLHAYKMFGMAVGEYRAGNKEKGYFYLGVVAHLLADTSVPTHAHNDWHGSDLFYHDNYDDIFMDVGAGRVKLSLEEENGITGLPGHGLVGIPDGQDPLYYLFYTTNQVADFFPSHDCGGDRNDYHGGWMSGVYTELGMDSLYYPSPDCWIKPNCIVECLNSETCVINPAVQRKYCYFYGVRSTATLFQYFQDTVDNPCWSTVVIEKVEGDDNPNPVEDVYYAKVNINDYHFQNKGVLRYGDPVYPNWAFAAPVGDTGTFSVNIQLYCLNPFGSHLDIKPDTKDEDLVFTVNLDNGAIVGDFIDGTWGTTLESMGTEGEINKRLIWVNVLPPPMREVSITPSTGFQGDHAMIYIIGTGFSPGVTCVLTRAGYDDIYPTVSAFDSTRQMRFFFNLENVAEGPWYMEVTSPYDMSTARALYSFTVLKPLRSTEITPNFGVQGTTVPFTITGTGFRDPTVWLDNTAWGHIPATLDQFSPTQITGQFVLPILPTVPHTTSWDLIVQNPGESNIAFFGGAFRIYAPLSIADISPNTGKAGTTVPFTIDGTGFQPDATVNLTKWVPPGIMDRYPATVDDITWSGTAMTCTFNVPLTAATGAWNVIVKNPDGQSVTLRDGFTIAAQPPTATAIEPASGVAGTTVYATITGTDFRSGSRVTLHRIVESSGGWGIWVTYNATNVEVVPGSGMTKITCRFDLPSTAATGPWTVQVTNPDGQSMAIRDGFTITAQPPTITAIAPASGIKGTTVYPTISGTGFRNGETVQLSKRIADVFVFIPATHVTLVNMTHIACTFALPSTMATGDWSVLVTNSDGQSASLPGGFTIVDPPPIVTSIVPTSGGQNTTVKATITGTGFQLGATVNLTRWGEGGILTRIPATNISVVSPTTISCQFAIPSTAAIGAWNVAVKNPNGQSGVLPDGFTVLHQPPTVASIEPTSGGQGTTFHATIYGTGFRDGATVNLSYLNRIWSKIIHPIPATNVSVTPRRIDCDFAVPSTAAMTAYNVVVKNPDGQSGVLPGGFTVHAAFAVTQISPSIGTRGTTVSATINGFGFVDGATAELRRRNPELPLEPWVIPATKVMVDSPTTIRCQFALPLLTGIGRYTLIVTNPRGQSAILTDEFTVFAEPPPTVISITPNTGDRGTTVAITNLSGTGFQPGAVVLLSQNNSGFFATDVVVVSPTMITCTFALPETAANGTWDVLVWNSESMNAILPAGFIITAPSPASIRVSAPNGGETFFKGSTLPMRWTYTGNPGNTVNIEVLKGGAILKVLSGIPIGSGGSGSYNVSIPASTPLGGDYRIRVTSATNTSITDTSDASFTIFISVPMITVTVPNGGESYPIGSTLPMSWTYTGNPGSTVNIEVLKGTSALKILTGIPIGTDGSGAYNVTIPASTPRGTDYKIRVTSTLNPLYTDISDGPFTISADSSSSITVVAPNGGENWVQGSTHSLSWTFTGNPGSSVKIEALRGENVLAVITPSTSIGSGGSGSYSLAFPYNTPRGDDFKIRVTSNDYPAYNDTSDAPFTISSPITVVAPNGGETWVQGSPQTIRWNYIGNPGPTVKIEVWRGLTVIAVITPSYPIGSGGSGSYSLTLPNNAPVSTNYRIKVTSTNYPACYDFSNASFTISAPG